MVRESAFVNWTNESVIKFAKGKDPINAVSEHAELLVLKALEHGWKGPPYDPFELAQLLRISVVPKDNVGEARTIAGDRGKFVIEFNPRLPASRIRFSIAHEIAHTFFSDCLERARYRATRNTYRDDDWQLEMLCNIGAAEMLMPTGSFASLRDEGYDINHLLDVRKQFGVSSEALLIRVVKLAHSPIACFAMSHRAGQLRLDYLVASRAWNISAGRIAAEDHAVTSQCTAIGYTAKGNETWDISGQRTPVYIQALGLPPYPGSEKIRVTGLVRAKSGEEQEVPGIQYRHGNALEPQGAGKKVLAHLVNDQTSRWGGAGFAAALKEQMPQIQDDFKEWAFAHKDEFRLGNTHISMAGDDLAVASMIAQHGYGPSDRPRIRYASLEKCLQQLAKYAVSEARTVHMPLIGTGYAGGDWAVIEELIEQKVCSMGVTVTVYKLPHRPTRQ